MILWSYLRENTRNIKDQVDLNLQSANKRRDDIGPAVLQISYLDFLVLVLPLKQQRGTSSNEKRIVICLFLREMKQLAEQTEEKQSLCLSLYFLLYFS